MARKKGGYQIVVLATLTYASALIYSKCGKPLLIEDGTNEPYYADSIEVDANENVVIRKGASSIVVAPNETITFNNFINNVLMEDIVDADGHVRFKVFEDTASSSTGMTKTYAKAILNGRTLSVVLAASMENTSVITDGQVLVSFSVDQWILDKVFPIFSNIIEVRNTLCYATDWSTQTLQVTFRKQTNSIQILANGNLTFAADRNVRMQFDLIID